VLAAGISPYYTFHVDYAFHVVMLKIIYQLASPKAFYQFAGKLLPWIWTPCLALFAYGLVGGLWWAPPDYQQGDAYRIIFIHVPAAALSLVVFVTMAMLSAIYLIWRIKLADVIAKVSAAIGAWFTFLALLTGALWGKPMWGTWWIWDARLTAELILLFIYLGIIALRSAITNPESAGRACGILTLMGLVDIPIVHYSVYWWNTLHQKSTILQFAKPSIASGMLYPLLAMLAAFFLYYLAVMLLRVRSEILVRESRTEWVKKLNGLKLNSGKINASSKF
jgi:heme exporter protein C